MNYYCYCTSNIKNGKKNSNKIKNYYNMNNKVEKSNMADNDKK